MHRSLLYRYLFYGWLFRDAGRGSLWQRAAALQHNREQAHWLPTYMRRWLVIGAALFALAWFVEMVLGWLTLSAFLYVPSVLSLPFNAVTVLGWFWLTSERPR